MGAALKTIGSLQNGQVTKNPVGVYTHDESIIKRAAVEEDIMKNYKQQKSHHKSKKQVCSIQVGFFVNIMVYIMYFSVLCISFSSIMLNF